MLQEHCDSDPFHPSHLTVQSKAWALWLQIQDSMHAIKSKMNNNNKADFHLIKVPCRCELSLLKAICDLWSDYYYIHGWVHLQELWTVNVYVRVLDSVCLDFIGWSSFLLEQFNTSKVACSKLFMALILICLITFRTLHTVQTFILNTPHSKWMSVQAFLCYSPAPFQLIWWQMCPSNVWTLTPPVLFLNILQQCNVTKLNWVTNQLLQSYQSADTLQSSRELI